MKLSKLIANATDKTKFTRLEDFIRFAHSFLDFAADGLQARIVCRKEIHYQFWQYKSDGTHNFTRPINTQLMLGESMIETCGFDERSADDALRVRSNPVQPGLGLERIPMSESPALDNLSLPLANKVRWEPERKTLVLEDIPSASELRQLQQAVKSDKDREAVDNFWRGTRPVGIAPKLPGEFAAPIRLPRLVVKQDDRRRLLEPIELDQFEWDLNRCDP